jgi:hypothetical protein
MDDQSAKTTKRGGHRGLDAHMRVKGRERHILVDTLGLARPAKKRAPARRSDVSAGSTERVRDIEVEQPVT